MTRCRWHRDFDRYGDEMGDLLNEGYPADHPLVHRARVHSVLALRAAALEDERDAGRNDYCAFEGADERTQRLGKAP